MTTDELKQSRHALSNELDQSRHVLGSELDQSRHGFSDELDVLRDGASDELDVLRDELQRVRGALPSRIDVTAEGAERGLAQLVLTLVEFVRQLLERQAVRRMEGGSLTDEEVERVGLALLVLEQKMHELAEQFGLEPADLNINLGPLGDLL